MTPFREALASVLTAEALRIEAKRGAWRGDDADKVKLCHEWSDLLRSSTHCSLTIAPDRKPWEIQL